MLKRGLLCLIAIVAVWMLVDLFLHYWLLAPLYLQNPAIWRTLSTLSAGLIHTVRIALAALLLGIYALQVHPKSMRAGLIFGVLTGLLLGFAVGVGTYIHSPIPQALMWGWFAGALLKSVLAGALLGAMIPNRVHQFA